MLILIKFNFRRDVMQDYAFLFKKTRLRPQQKLSMIRRVLRCKIPQSIMVAAIIFIVEGVNRR